MFTKYLFSPLNLYFSRIFTLWIAASSFIVMFVIVLVDSTELSRRSVTFTKIRFEDIMHLVALKIPFHFQTLLPFVVLLAAIITLSRLTRSNEAIVARGFGISIWQLASGLSGVVVILSVVLLAVVNPVSAVLNQKQEELEQRLFTGRDVAVTVFEDGLWLRENKDDRHSIVNISRINPTKKIFEELSFQTFSKDYVFISRIDANTAIIHDGKWYLKDVSVYNSKQEMKKLAKLEIETDLSFDKILTSNLAPRFVSFWKLPEYITVLEKSGLSSIPYQMHWHSMLGKIGFMISLVFLGAAFTMRPPRQGYATFLVVLAIASGLVLHFFNDVVYALGLAQRLPVLVAAWAPAVTVFLLSTTLILHLEEG